MTELQQGQVWQLHLCGQSRNCQHLARVAKFANMHCHSDPDWQLPDRPLRGSCHTGPCCGSLSSVISWLQWCLNVQLPEWPQPAIASLEKISCVPFAKDGEWFLWYIWLKTWVLISFRFIFDILILTANQNAWWYIRRWSFQRCSLAIVEYCYRDVCISQCETYWWARKGMGQLESMKKER